MPDRKPVVELREVVKDYRTGFWLRRVRALDHVNLEMYQGEILGYLGPNGAGKTTTIKLMVGLIYPEQGTVRVLGGTPSDPEVKRQIGFMPENPYFYDYLEVTEFLDVLGRVHGLRRPERRRRIEELLALLKLEEHARKRIRHLSKGLKQRVGLAQALLGEPALLILDEPLSGLDPLGRWEIRQLIASFRGTRTVFFSTHILSDLEMVCDRVAMIYAGRIVRTAPISDLMGTGVQGYDIWVTGRPGPEPLPPGLVLKWQGSSELQFWCPDETTLTAFLHWLNRQPKLKIRALQPIRYTLEDIFVRTIRDQSEGRA